MTHQVPEQDPSLVAMFLSEASELLDALEACLLDLLSRPDDELINKAFRTLHTLKGAATMYGYDELSARAHALESDFDDARRAGATPQREALEHALREADAMRRLLSGHSDAPSVEPLQPDGGTRRFRVLLHPAHSAFVRGLRLDGIVAELASLGECQTTAQVDTARANDSDAEAACTPLLWRVDLASSFDRDRVSETLMFLSTNEYELQEPEAEVAELAADRRELDDRRSVSRRSESRRAADAREGETIRVASHRLDELVDLVGELVTAHGTMSALAAESADPRLNNVAEEIGRLAGDLRENVLGIRMVPIGSVFGRFRRHVHDLAAELGKQAEIVMEGGETELDKGVLDRLAEPILHILRNSLDHGIEAPEARLAADKAAVGRISLTASQAGGRVHVHVSDDGAGLDLNRIREKAIQRGLIGAEAVVSDGDLTQLLFDSGFSTSDEVTSVSGRGVGLDVVKRNLEGLHGTVSLSTVPGQGTTISLSLPLTLAIIDGLISEVGTERYAIPLAIVEECAEVKRPEAWKSHQRDLIDVHGTLLPLVHLRSIFDVAGEPPDYQIAVIVSVDDRRFGVVVDSLIDSVQTVIKPLGTFIKRADGLSGTTVLGDGSVVPIIDPAELVKIADFGQVQPAVEG